ncbi:hypothetical protein D3C77_583930 [compost metagenome]
MKASVCRLPVVPLLMLLSNCDSSRDSSWLVKRSRAEVPASAEARSLIAGSSWSFCAWALLSNQVPFNGLPPNAGLMGVYTSSVAPAWLPRAVSRTREASRRVLLLFIARPSQDRWCPAAASAACAG